MFSGLGTALSGAAGGFAAGLIGSNGDFKGGLQGALSGGLFGFAAGVTDPGVERIAAHAAAGCISSAAGRGSCGSGALSGAAAKFATGQLDGHTGLGDIGKGIAAVVVGGTASVIGGGKFENGAVTAAYGYLFNQAAHSGRDPLTRHNLEVERLISEDIGKGYGLAGRNVRVEMDGQVRIYDYVIRDPVAEVNIGKEVKTTLFSTVFLNPRQVDFDVSLTMRGGAFSQSGIFIKGVAYEAVCFMCANLNVRGWLRANALEAAGIPIIRSTRPGIYERR